MSSTAAMLFVFLLCSSTATLSAKKSTTEEAIANLIINGLDDFYELLEYSLKIDDFTKDLVVKGSKILSAKKSTTEEAIANLIVYGLDDFYEMFKDCFTGKDFVVKGSKKVLKHVVEELLKNCSQESMCKEAMDKFRFKQTFRNVFIREFGQKRVKDFALKASIRASKLLKAANLVGLAADLAQFVLEYYDYPTAGKIVGAVGNTASGAMAGFALGLWVYTETELQHDFTELLSM